MCLVKLIKLNDKIIYFNDLTKKEGEKMFLNRLTLEEKEAFLLLAYKVAHSDNDFAEEEEVMIAKYCMEMQMDDIEYDESKFDLDRILDTFISEQHKKIVLLEIMALVYADGIVAKEEEELIQLMIEKFNLNPNLAVVYREWSKSILSLFVQGEALVHL